MSNSPLVNQTILTMNRGNYDSYGNRQDGRWSSIKKITIHHTAGVVSAVAVANSFLPAARQASANYIVGSDGTIVMSVEEANRAWTSGSATNDNQAITIEVCNSTGAPEWKVSDKALETVINLCVDICKRNNISKLNFTGDATGNLTMHRYFQATACPGPYLASKFPYIADQVNAILAGKPTEPIVDTITPTYQVYTKRNGWLGQISGYNNDSYDGYAGWRGQAIQGIRCFVSNYKVKYRAHLKGGNWLSWVSKADNTDEGYAGWYGNDIDAIQMTLVDAPAGYHIEYRTSLLGGDWLDWIRDYKETGTDGYSGWIGKSLDRLQVRVVKDNTVTVKPTIPTTPTTSAPSTPDLKVGDLIALKSNATYINGKVVPTFIINSPLYVREVRKDENIVFSTQKTGAITGVINPSMILNASVSKNVPYTIKLLPGTPIYIDPTSTAIKFNLLLGGTYTIVQEQNGYGKLKSGAGWVKL